MTDSVCVVNVMTDEQKERRQRGERERARVSHVARVSLDI